MDKELEKQLFEEILRARSRVYEVGQPTPLQEISQEDDDFRTFIKREDLGPINAYKWRGAYNCTSVLKEHDKNCHTIVAASAGNHAQGVALAARRLDIQAKIFMPLSTPMMKQTSVKRHGGSNVEIILTGDTYNEAGDAAKKYSKENNLPYIHPFDDIYTIAGQATIADEIILSGEGSFDYAFIQIGGGGIASGISSWLKIHNPDIKVIGVEGVDQASMQESVLNNRAVTLESVDTFCDGTAVTRPGDLTFEICRKYIDEYITVTNEEVSAAIQKLWESKRLIPEPSGAMGLAGLVKYAQNHRQEVKGKKLLSIICGANMDFEKIRLIADKSAIGANTRHYIRFHIGEEKGGLLSILDNHFHSLNVSEFLYGKIHESKAWPIIAIDGSPQEMQTLYNSLDKSGIKYEDVTKDADIQYRIINYNPALFKNPLFMKVHFPERKGALRDFLRDVSPITNICYFNYAHSGEMIGRALMGFEFESEEDKTRFHEVLQKTTVKCTPLDKSVTKRILE